MIIRSQSVITKAAVARGLHGVVIVSLRNLFIHLPLFIIFACLYKLRKVTPLRSNPLKRLVRLRSVFGLLLFPCKWVQFFSSSFSQGEIIRKASIFLLLLLKSYAKQRKFEQREIVDKILIPFQNKHSNHFEGIFVQRNRQNFRG